jgi:hypothetical protein
MGETGLQAYLEVTQEAGIALVRRGITGPVVMLNLLRFRELADYSAAPHLAPAQPVSGAEAYRRYIDHTLPHLGASGGEVIFFGAGGPFLIGPAHERWDACLIVRHRSVGDFIASASNAEYGAGLAHRVAALEDSRLLPLVEQGLPGRSHAV